MKLALKIGLGSMSKPEPVVNTLRLPKSLVAIVKCKKLFSARKVSAAAIAITANNNSTRIIKKVPVING